MNTENLIQLLEKLRWHYLVMEEIMDNGTMEDSLQDYKSRREEIEFILALIKDEDSFKKACDILGLKLLKGNKED